MFGSIQVSQFDYSQDLGEWLNAVRMNATLHSLDAANTLVYAVGMLAPEIRTVLATVADDQKNTMDRLTTWLTRQVAANQNVRS